MKSTNEEPKKFSNEIKKHFLEIVSTYNKYQEQMDRKSDITKIAETLGGITEAACELAINEGDDWFDKHTVKRNMSELTKLGKQFDKVAMESKSLDQRLAGLYEDMGHILSRYYKIGEISESEMKTRLGIKESITEAKKVPTKQEIIDYLVKHGNNPNNAKKIVDKQYDHVISAWKGSSLRHMADVVSTLGLDEQFESLIDEVDHGYEQSAHVSKHNDEYKLAQQLVKKAGKNEMKFYDELESIHEKLGHPKYMKWLSAALRGYNVDMYRDSKIKNQSEAEEALFLLSK